MSLKLVPGLDPAHYQRHALHDPERAWPETNCYVDLWIETLHGLGLDPTAALAFCAGIDLEGDQWTFFKYPIADMEQLYGFDVIELNIWQSLIEQVGNQIELGRAPVVELDSYFLPDTHGVSYQIEHVKTSCTVETLDVNARRMSYFHGAGYWALEGNDFDGVFRRGEHTAPAGVVHLPPYVEVAKLNVRSPLTGDALAQDAWNQLRRHLAGRPKQNPFIAYRPKFERDLVWLKDADLPSFHGYAFANVRMFGACFELLASFARWLAARSPASAEVLTQSATDFDEISTTAKTLQFKLARAVQGKRAVDFQPMLDALVAAYDRGLQRLDHAVAS